MRYFVNREQIVYLEAIPDREEKPFWVQTSREAEVTRKLSGFSGAPCPRRQRRSG